MLDFLRRAALARLVAMTVVMLAALAGVQALHFLVFAKHLPLAADFALTLAACATALGLYALLVRGFERRWPAELALKLGLRWAGLGVLTGLAMFVTLYVVLTALGAVRLAGFHGLAGAGPMLLMAMVAGVTEELVFRGVLFRVIEDASGTAAALAVSALIFGLMHAANPGATPISTTAIVLEAGVMLAAAYAWSRSLWMPIGLHMAWNFAEGGIFGAAVSGGTSKGILAVAVSPSASPLVTGGAFGPEASLVAVLLGLVLGAAFLIAAGRAGHWRDVSWRMLLA